MIPPPFGRAGVGFSIIFSGGPGWVSLSCGYRAKNSKYQAENQQVPNEKAKQVVLVEGFFVSGKQYGADRRLTGLRW